MVQHIFLFRQILCLSLSMILYPKLSRNRWSFCTWKSTKRNVNPWHLCTAVLTHSRTFCSPRASVLIFHVLQTKTMQKINTDKRLTRTVRLSIAKPWRKTHSFLFFDSIRTSKLQWDGDKRAFLFSLEKSRNPTDNDFISGKALPTCTCTSQPFSLNPDGTPEPEGYQISHSNFSFSLAQRHRQSRAGPHANTHTFAPPHYSARAWYICEPLFKLTGTRRERLTASTPFLCSFSLPFFFGKLSRSA